MRKYGISIVLGLLITDTVVTPSGRYDRNRNLDKITKVAVMKIEVFIRHFA